MEGRRVGAGAPVPEVTAAVRAGGRAGFRLKLHANVVIIVVLSWKNKKQKTSTVLIVYKSVLSDEKRSSARGRS